VANIFISYTSSDHKWAKWIAKELKALKHTPLIHEWEIGGGDDIYGWMDKHFDAADRVICVFSDDYMKAPYSTLERNAALWKAATNQGFVLLVVVQPCNVPGLANQLSRCDLYGLSDKVARARFRDLLAKPKMPGRIAFPGEAFAVSNIPIRVPPHFMGRDDALAGIDAAMKRYEGRVAITALHGMRGVGKTTLAAAYAEHHRGDYRATWWIRAQTEPTMRADLIGLGLRLQWVAAGDNEEAALASVMERLRNEGRGLLLIYDNAIEAAALRPYLPRGGEVRVIVTSNAHVWRGVAEPLAISLWPKEIGADYLIARTGRETERAAAETLSHRLAGLPLAHEQAAAYCERLEMSLAEYQARFDATPVTFLKDDSTSPAEYHDGRTLAKTFALAIEEAARLHPAAELLILHAALLSPEPIPLFLFSEGRERLGEPLASALKGDELLEALRALRSFALVDREMIVDERDPSVTTDSIRLHRLVRIVANDLLDSAPAGLELTRERALGNLVAALDAVFPEDRNPRIWRLFPHVVEMLQTLSGDYGQSGNRDYYSKLARLVVMALHVTEDKQRAGKIIPDYLATVLGDFYEVEPLKGPLRLLLSEHRELWPKLEKDFLSTNNYVLRYAVAEAWAYIYRRQPALVQITDITQKVSEDRAINEFEVGGYALGLIYAREPGSIDPSMLQRLAQRREYTGRSILGDLFLNLAFSPALQSQKDLRGLVDADRFWRPIWDYVKIDIWAIEAAQAFWAKPRRTVADGGSPEARQDYDNFIQIEKDIGRLSGWRKCGENLRAMLERYWALGSDTDLISNENAGNELSKFDRGELCEMMGLLFAHPIWVVAESAATTLISLLAVRKDSPRFKEDWIGIVDTLLADKNWRVQYGACEAAFIMSEHKELHEQGTDLFHRVVRQFYNAPNCKIRGNCAENLFSFILNSSASKWPDLIAGFDTEMRYWLRDEDCWVLEHVFRFFETLKKRHVNFDRLLSSEQSPLFAGAPEWYLFDRQDFLLHIERRKEEIIGVG
jgi:hypothetical protein